MSYPEVILGVMNEEVKLPVQRLGDAMYDLYPYFDSNAIVIMPNDTELIPTGICSSIEKGYYIEFKERGSNTLSNLLLRAGVIDSNYTGEWFIALTNVGKVPVSICKSSDIIKITKGNNCIYVPYSSALCQFRVVKGTNPSLIVKTYDEVSSRTTNRGSGKLGSSELNKN